MTVELANEIILPLLIVIRNITYIGLHVSTERCCLHWLFLFFIQEAAEVNRRLERAFYLERDSAENDKK